MTPPDRPVAIWTFLVLTFGAVLHGGIVAFGGWRWKKATRVLITRLDAAGASEGIERYDVRMIAGLPAPVRRYFERALSDGQSIIRSVDLALEGSFNMSLDAPKWKPFTSTQHVVARRPGFVWNARIALNFIYVHLNRVIKKYDLDMTYVSGPGHGGPAVVANTYLEGTYTEIYPNMSQDEAGLQKLFKQFSFPGGIPSHASPEYTGSIHKGGELGYSLSHSFGAVFDNPDLIVACCVGDGEAETGPLATSWQSNKFLDPINDGAVLPILHLNGYKIANPTLLARIEPDTAERDNGDDEGRTSEEILKSRPDWNPFRDGSPNGETPAQISARADRFIAHLRALAANVALFSHSHFGRVLAARWIGLPAEQAQHLLLNTASPSVLCSTKSAAPPTRATQSLTRAVQSPSTKASRPGREMKITKIQINSDDHILVLTIATVFPN